MDMSACARATGTRAHGTRLTPRRLHARAHTGTPYAHPHAHARTPARTPVRPMRARGGAYAPVRVPDSEAGPEIIWGPLWRGRGLVQLAYLAGAFGTPRTSSQLATQLAYLARACHPLLAYL